MMAKNVNCLLVSVLMMISVVSSGQKAFNDCSAAFLDNKMVVDEYTARGKCVMPASAKGTLTVCTADLSPTESTAKDKISFRIAKGDQIVLLTTDSQYALPHNEIQVL